jgi:hypothetical protein
VWWRAALVALAAAAALAPVPSHLVERVYSSGVYPLWQPHITRLSNLTPVALLDVLLIVVVATWIAVTVRDVRRGSWLRAAVSAGLRTIVWSAGFYIVFLGVWGLNYRRVPLVEVLQFDASAVSPASVRDLAFATVDRMNVLYGDGHRATAAAAGDVDSSLAAAFSRALGDLGRSAVIVPARPKWTVLDAYFRRAGVDGMTDPYFLETLVAGELLPVERPFVVAHEWSHLAGIADEGEANFVGWLTCMRGVPAYQYSASLLLYAELAGALRGRDRSLVAARLAQGPRDDLLAIARRHEQHVNRRVAAVGWRVYDRYLKANHVERGAASYADVVRLIIGVRVSASGVPLRRSVE